MIFHYDVEAKHFPDMVFMYWLELWSQEWVRQNHTSYTRALLERLDEKILALQPAEDWGTLN